MLTFDGREPDDRGPDSINEQRDALACELPARYGLPLGRFSRTELYRLAIELAVTDASASTIWRWLHEDAIKPWQQQCWIYRRDPEFAEQAGLAICTPAFDGKRLRSAVRSSQYGRMRLILVRRIFRGLTMRSVVGPQGQSRIRPWRISHA